MHCSLNLNDIRILSNHKMRKKKNPITILLNKRLLKLSVLGKSWPYG